MPTALRERDIYERVVGASRQLDPSQLLYELDRVRSVTWTATDLASRWRAAVRSAPHRAVWNMYVHIPFCKSICTFCNYKRLRVSSREALAQYVSFLVREMAAFSSALGGVTFGALYIGGGTPSVLPPRELDRLLTGVHEAFAFRDSAQKNFEYDPMVMTDDRFAVLDRFGFTRFSFGIQSIDVEVNSLHNRGPQGPGHVAKQFDMLERHGAQSVNVDFLLGLDGTTPEQILGEIEETLRNHRPTEITVYFVTPTPAYVTAQFSGSFAQFEAHMAPFNRVAGEGLEDIAVRNDYAIVARGPHVVVLRNRRQVAAGGASAQKSEAYHYSDIPSQVHRPLFLLGLGDSARSRIFGSARYRAEHDDAAVARQSPRYVGTAIDLRDEMFAYVALALRDTQGIERRLFRRTFGIDIVDAYPKALAKLEELSAVTIGEASVKLDATEPRARLRDTLFFLSRARRNDLALVV